MLETISITELREMSAEKLKADGKCYEITSDGQVFALLIVPQTDYIKEHTRQLGVLSNSVHTG